MPLSNEELLQKATFTTPDLGGALSVQQATRFIDLMTYDQELLKEVNVVTHNSAKWQEATIDFASRIAKPGVQAQRLAEADRTKPATNLIEFSTVLIKGEVPISEEALEDALTGAGSFQAQVTDLVARRFGFDVEELMIAGDVASADPYLALTDGYLKEARGPGGNQVDAAGHTTTTQTLRALLQRVPDRFKKGIRANGRFWTGMEVEERWRNELSDRGTALGDMALTSGQAVTFQGIPLVGLANMPVNTVPTPDTTSILFTDRRNLYAGFRRQIRMRTWEDAPAGLVSFLVDARVDARIALVQASAIANNVSTGEG